jgi:hypothetical protein
MPVRDPLLPTAIARAAEERRIGRLCSERAACRGLHVWGIERGRCGGRAVAVLSEGTLARDVTKEYSSGTPPYGVQCAGAFRGTWLLWVRRSTAERPSRLRMCRYLSDIALTGSVPSSLSALTNLLALCVPRSCQRGLRVRPRSVGSVGSAPSARHVGGCMSWGIERGRCGSRAVSVLSEMTLARDVTTEYSIKGHPSLWGTVRGYLQGHMVAVGAA